MARRPKRGAPPDAPAPEEAANCPALLDDDSVRRFKELMAMFAYTGSSGKPREKVVSPYFQKGNAGDTQTPLAPRKTILSPCLKKTAMRCEEREKSQVEEMDAAHQDSVLLKVASAQSESSKPPRCRDSRGKKIRISPCFPKSEADEVKDKMRDKVVSPYFQKGKASDTQTPLAPHNTILSPCLKKITKRGEEREKLQVEDVDVAQQDSVLPTVVSGQSERNKAPRCRDSKGRTIRTSPYFAKSKADEVKAKRRERAKRLREEEKQLVELFPWKRRTLKAAERKLEAYKRKSADNKWMPPRSRHHLMQEDHFHDPWRVLVICMLLNVTTGKQTRQILDEFFERYPDANSASVACPVEMEGMIRGLGLQKKRTQMIKRLSAEYLGEDWQYVTELHGVGKYAADAYAIFCNGKWNEVDPGDHKLRDYWMDSFFPKDDDAQGSGDAGAGVYN